MSTFRLSEVQVNLAWLCLSLALNCIAVSFTACALYVYEISCQATKEKQIPSGNVKSASLSECCQLKNVHRQHRKCTDTVRETEGGSLQGSTVLQLRPLRKVLWNGAKVATRPTQVGRELSQNAQSEFPVKFEKKTREPVLLSFLC